MPTFSRFCFSMLLQGTASHAVQPVADAPDRFDIDRLASYVKALEAAGYGLVVIGEALDRSSASLESFTQAAYFAFHTKDMALAVAANTNYIEPFSIARLIASQDHVTHGRTAWLVTSDETKESAANHQSAVTDHNTRASRRAEAIDVIDRLCDTWQDDAFTRDKSTGNFIDTTKVTQLDHRGVHFVVRGPLNVARPPQGHIPKLTYVDADALMGSAGINVRHYDTLLTLGLSDAHASRLRNKANANTRIFKVVVPLIESDTKTARRRIEDYLAAVPLDRDWQYGAAPGREYSETGDFYGTDGLAPVGTRNAAAVSAITGHDFIGAPADLLIDDAIRAALNPRGHALVGVAQQRADLLSTSARSTTPIRLIDLLRAFVEPREIFVGTLARWHEAVRQWSRTDSPFDGLLIAPAVEDALDADFAKRLAKENLT